MIRHVIKEKVVSKYRSTLNKISVMVKLWLNRKHSTKIKIKVLILAIQSGFKIPEEIVYNE